MRAQIASPITMEYDDEGRGRPVVLLHAFPLARAMWRPQVEALRRTVRLIVPDQRGFGATAGFGDEPPSLDRMADDVAALLDALRIAEPVVLGGLSMGGYVALAFARRHAARLRGLILADTRSEADTAEAKANRDNLIQFAANHSASDVIAQMLPKLLGEQTRTNRPEVVEEVRRIASAQTPAGIIGALRAMRDRPDATPTLATIAVPTLVLVGAEDALTPPALAEGLAAHIPQARLVKIAAAGHLANLEQPPAFNEALGTFLAALGTQRPRPSDRDPVETHSRDQVLYEFTDEDS
jgi:pimeloyl-ACP methyl ester carboxylesterase